jgi:uncharacterized membrane protein
MKPRNKIIALTILIWAFVSITYAYVYVASILSHSGLQGYESEWQFHLLMFSIVRLPLLIGALVVFIGLKVVLLQNKSLTHHSSGTPNGAP